MTAFDKSHLATLDDIVFEFRNKAYGAYDLRSRYQRNSTRALGLGILLYGAALALPGVLNKFDFKTEPDRYMQEVTLENLRTEPIETPPVVLPPEPVRPVLSTIRNLPPEVVTEAPEEITVPTTDELKDKVSSDKTVEGSPEAEEMIEAPSETAGPTSDETALGVKEKEPEIFLKVEQDPQFPGGMSAFQAYMQKNLRFPPAAVRANVTGKVYVQFVVDSDGSIGDVKVLKGIGFECDEEAVRVIRKMPRWQPGKQSGKAVKVRFNMPVVFALE